MNIALRPISLSMILMLSLVLGCGGNSVVGPETPPLRIAAAADLQRALPDLLAAYKARDDSVAEPSFGASGDLAEQIRGGAPFDVFLSADMSRPEALEAQGVVEKGSVVPYARGALVLLVHPSVAGEVASLADLQAPGVRKIALANPEIAPYGQAARNALEKAGLWDLLQPKLVIAGSVSQALMHVEQGNADAALVSRSLVDGGASKVVDVDPSLYPPRIQGLGIVARSTQKERARRFIEFLRGEDGQLILERRGFQSPQP
ncbi:molybdate ABC transporter substrate-binding protein [Paludisphaera rhizosphaerae]|uniref:molybdate ABC transporter substrate-binding protein n=1 Tax=Paludisphaera rhizosphaerae TaxID=2711216 RepID=UPI0013EAB29B|nr:molybdate ABC transporter substrate-binding protein [Paludisphaera rhizosphaerae]